MSSLDDLTFMPFDSHVDGDGNVEVAVDDEVSLFLRAVDGTEEDGSLPHTALTISAMGKRSIAVP